MSSRVLALAEMKEKTPRDENYKSDKDELLKEKRKENSKQDTLVEDYVLGTSHNTIGAPESTTDPRRHNVTHRHRTGDFDIVDLEDIMPLPSDLHRLGRRRGEDIQPGAYHEGEELQDGPVEYDDHGLDSGDVGQVENNQNGSLIRARAVEEEDLQRAVELATADEDIGDGVFVHNGRKCAWSKRWVLLALWLLGCIAVVAVAVSVTRTSSPEVPTAENSATEQPQMDLTREERVLLLLPEFSLRAIQVDSSVASSTPSDGSPSPQTQAYWWVLNDPRLDQYPNWRIVQRFALVTVYYALGGENWYHSWDWLSYEVEEHLWYMPGVMDKMAFGGEPTTEEHSEREEQGRNQVPSFKSLYRDPNPIEAGLSHLWLNNNGLKGELPQEFFLLTSLRTVDMGLNPDLRGTISSDISNLQTLQSLSMTFSSLSGSIPTQIGLMENLLWLYLEGNKFTGSLPTQIGSMSLWALQFGPNQISGVIPSQIGLLTNLISFAGGQNQLTSAIPSELGLLTSLRYFSFDVNQFSGTIPTELGQLMLHNFMLDVPRYGETMRSMFWNEKIGDTMLMMMFGLQNQGIISLHDNPFLTGFIPAELASMANIGKLYLHRTALIGTVPSQMGLIDNIVFLSLPGTSMSGPIPEEVCKIDQILVVQTTCDGVDPLDCSSCQNCLCQT